MAGFAHDIAGGSGDLVITSVQSPNFVHGVSGWRIARDGSAEFQDVILPAGTGGTVVTFAASAPPSPAAGDVWYDTADGLLASVWDGSAWVPYQIGGAAIAAGAITAAQIQAGIVLAGVVNGTTVTGAQIIADGASGEYLAYSGTPAAGNLIASVSAAAGTDSHGNAYLQGITAYQAGSLAVTLIGGAVIWYTASSYAGPWSYAGQLEISAGTLIADFGAVETTGTLSVSGGQLSIGGRTDTATNIGLSPPMGIPPGYPLSTSVATDPYSGSTWVSGERALINAWPAAINAIAAALNSLISEMQNRGLIS